MILSRSLEGELLGNQEPRFHVGPNYVDTRGPEAIELARLAGVDLMPWQRNFLMNALGVDEYGKWAAFEVALIVPRQNGKTMVAIIRELAGLYLFDEGLIVHTAHEYATALEAFRTLHGLIDNSDFLRRRVRQIRTARGEEGIELLNGSRLRVKARSKGSARGYSGDTVVIDEAWNYSDTSHEALMPIMAARPNPQLWYLSMAADKDIAPAEPLSRLRERALKIVKQREG
jgi:phage terminase large subunit-like protein